jgi:hypothetical protein
MSEPNEDDLITVCDSCLQASCWQGHFMCDEYRNAGIKRMKRSELRKLDRENPCYWKTDLDLIEEREEHTEL